MRLLVADDTRDLNRALTALLERSGYEVVSAFDGQEAVDRVLGESFDGIILDIMMPRKDGLSALRELRERGIETPVLLLTAKSQVDDRVRGLDAGADDYLPKPFALKELLARVRAMTKRRADSGPSELRFGDIRLDLGSSELSAENSVRLSVKELELLRLLMMNADRPLGPAFILGQVWGEDGQTGPDVLELYLSYLRSKLDSVASDVRIEGSDEEGWCLRSRPALGPDPDKA
ncbi:response regulator transcription factor [Olsenella urininfantis]|uniref:response regulator transcription factor n=1 Tax=Olsenella urininfantis TaxID=1871033 RepID=UPI000985951D|nr:response regulator transcription factor [Olsenella urininfantis]